jgi:tetratricopeptide (TPR) repeat protein
MNSIWKSTAARAALLLLLTVVAYLPALRGGFIWDDDVLITDNRMIKAGNGLRRFWLTTEAPDYWPLTSTAWWLEWRLWNGSPTGYHVANVLLHAVNAVLVWLVLRRLDIPGAWLAAAVFAVHPVNVATVAWISEQKNTLSMLFFAVSVWLYLRFDEAVVGPRCVAAKSSVGPRCDASESSVGTRCDASEVVGRDATPSDTQRGPTGETIMPVVGRDAVPRVQAATQRGPTGAVVGRAALRGGHGPGAAGPYLAMSLVCFLLALFSKTAVVMLPLVLLGCVWWRHRRIRWKDLLYSLPFFALSLIMGLVTVWFQYHRVLGPEGQRMGGWASRLAAAGWKPWFYLYKALWPADLMVIYPKWQPDPSRWVSYLPGVLLLGCFVVFWRYRRTWGRPLLFGLGYFVVMLLPVLGFFNQSFYQYSTVADHWQYYSIIGVIALVIGACSRGAQSPRPTDQPHADRAAWLQKRVLLGVALLLALGVATWRRSAVYADSVTLWRDTVASNPKSSGAYNNLGHALEQSGRFQEAIGYFQQALELNPANVKAHNNLGTVLAQVGRLKEAMDQFAIALQIDPDNFDAHCNLAKALFMSGRPQGAIKQYELALRLNPDDAETHCVLGNAWFALGKIQEAADQWEQAVRLKPDYVEARNNLGAALAQSGRLPEAIEQFERVLRLTPGDAETHYNLGVALEQSGRVKEAVAQYEQALRLRPDYAEAQMRLAAVKAKGGVW